jgi:hypothetical protein
MGRQKKKTSQSCHAYITGRILRRMKKRSEEALHRFCREKTVLAVGECDVMLDSNLGGQQLVARVSFETCTTRESSWDHKKGCSLTQIVKNRLGKDLDAASSRTRQLGADSS